MVNGQPLNYSKFLQTLSMSEDLKDILKDTLFIKSDCDLFRTLLYLNFKGDPLRSKSLYRVFRNAKGRTQKIV